MAVDDFLLSDYQALMTALELQFACEELRDDSCWRFSLEVQRSADPLRAAVRKEVDRRLS